MKLKLKGASSCTIAIAVPRSVQQDTVITLSVKKKRKELVHPSLLHRINSCKTLAELTQLLFATTEKTEAVLKAFDQKIDALEKEGQTLFHHPVNYNNNGSTTPTNAA